MCIAIDPPPRHKFRELVSGPFMPDALVPAYFMTWLAALVPTPRVNLTRFDSPFARTPAQQQLPGLHELG